MSGFSFCIMKQYSYHLKNKTEPSLLLLSLITLCIRCYYIFFNNFLCEDKDFYDPVTVVRAPGQFYESRRSDSVDRWNRLVREWD